MFVISILKSLLKKHPYLLTVTSLVYNVISFNNVKIRGINNRVQLLKSFAKRTKVVVLGENNNIEIGSQSIIDGCIFYINGSNNRIIVGENVSIRDTELHIEDNNNEIYVGDNSTFYGKTHLACIEGTKIFIGSDCMFSSDVTFRTGDSHSVVDNNGIRTNKSQDIYIGSHVWIGNKVQMSITFFTGTVSSFFRSMVRSFF